MGKVSGVLRPAKVMLLGQAPGPWEVKRGVPFCGPAGHELDKWLVQTGLAEKVWVEGKEGKDGHWGVSRRALAFTYVWDEEFPAGGLAVMTATRKEAKAEGWEPRGTPVLRGRYLREEWWGWQERLAAEVAAVNPNVIIGFGNEALWALSGNVGVEAWRGAPFMSGFRRADGSPVKAIATFHPAAIVKGGFRNRALAIADLWKAAKISETSTLELPRRELWLSPSLRDLQDFGEKNLEGATWLSVDIETGGGEITSVGFAPTPRLGICCPFVVDGTSYWENASDEVAAWMWVKKWCESSIPKVLQNGMYDAQWLWVKRGIRLRNYLHDTRLMHHALFPELPKSLGFMGALHENEQAWKQWSARHSEKRDDA